MRLIDADKIKQSVTNEMFNVELHSPVYNTLEYVIADIDNQPTAFDLESVIAEIKLLRDCAEERYNNAKGMYAEHEIRILYKNEKSNYEKVLKILTSAANATDGKIGG